MQPFELDRQALAFLAFIALVAGALVFLAPFALILIAAAGVVLAVLAWLRSALRARRLFGPLSAGEGALVAGSAIFIAGAASAIVLLVLRLGFEGTASLTGAMMPLHFESGERRTVTSSVHYGNPETQETLKRELAKAGIPFTLETREGKEYVAWSREHAAAAEAINAKVGEGPLPAGRSVRFGDPETQKQFADWLGRKGIKSRTVRAYGEDYLAWDEGAGDVRALMSEFMTERAARDCKDAKARPC